MSITFFYFEVAFFYLWRGEDANKLVFAREHAPNNNLPAHWRTATKEAVIHSRVAASLPAGGGSHWCGANIPRQTLIHQRAKGAELTRPLNNLRILR